MLGLRLFAQSLQRNPQTDPPDPCTRLQLENLTIRIRRRQVILLPLIEGREQGIILWILRHHGGMFTQQLNRLPVAIQLHKGAGVQFYKHQIAR